jgi:hypothetical protein
MQLPDWKKRKEVEEEEKRLRNYGPVNQELNKIFE